MPQSRNRIVVVWHIKGVFKKALQVSAHLDLHDASVKLNQDIKQEKVRKSFNRKGKVPSGQIGSVILQPEGQEADASRHAYATSEIQSLSRWS